MPGMGDMARMMAAGGGGGGGGMGGDGGQPDLEAQDPNAPEDGPEAAGDPTEQVEQALQMIMGAVEQFPGDLAEKARKHVEGLMEICQQAEAAGGQGAEEGAEGQEPAPDGQSGQSEAPPGGPSVGGSPVSYGA